MPEYMHLNFSSYAISLNSNYFSFMCSVKWVWIFYINWCMNFVLSQSLRGVEPENISRVGILNSSIKEVLRNNRSANLTHFHFLVPSSNQHLSTWHTKLRKASNQEARADRSTPSTWSIATSKLVPESLSGWTKKSTSTPGWKECSLASMSTWTLSSMMPLKFTWSAALTSDSEESCSKEITLY